AIGLLPLVHGFAWWVVAMVLLGLGTALVYPTLLAAVSDVAHPAWRASAVGVYRLWRDSGYAIGALLAGVLTDLFGVSWAIGGIAGVTFLSGVIVQAVMAETLPSKPLAQTPTMYWGSGCLVCEDEGKERRCSIQGMSSL